jgi:SNF2 family DNA or RNA helicase
VPANLYQLQQWTRRGSGPPPVVLGQPVVLKVDASYGRLYVGGPSAGRLATVRGSTWNEKRRAFEMSLTLDSLREIASKLAISKERLWQFCSEPVKAWARAAGLSEKGLKHLHEQMAAGYRVELPWVDNRRDTPAPPSAQPREVYYDENGVLRYLYRAPFAHQGIMSTLAVELDGAAFLCEMGTAKTRSAIEAMAEKFRRGAIDVCIAVCPNGVKRTWEREVATWLEQGRVQVIRLDGKVKDRERAILARAELIERGVARTPELLVVNYEVLHNLTPALVALSQVAKVGVILDEMHRVADPETQVTKAAMELARHAEWRLGLTGTPIRNSVTDVWSQWYFIDLGLTFGANMVQFRREFFDENVYEWSLDPKEGALDEIGKRLRLRGVRFRKQDCMDLPPKVYEVVEVEMTPEQARAYREMEEHLVARLRAAEERRTYRDADEDVGPNTDPDADENLATAATQLVAILRLTQITSGFVPTEAGTLHRFPVNPKMNALEEIVRDTIRDQQQIIWAQYREDHDRLMERFRDLRPRVIRGGVPLTERNEIEEMFQNGECRLIIGQPAAAGVGLNLQRGSMAHYFSQGYSLIDRSQSEDRCHRAGSEMHSRVLYTDYVCRGTVDEVVREALLAKKELSEVVVDLKNALGV